MAEMNKTAEKKLEKLTGAVDRRKAALGKLRGGGEKAGGVGERQLIKLLKRAQRRAKKLLADQARLAGGKAVEGESA